MTFSKKLTTLTRYNKRDSYYSIMADLSKRTQITYYSSSSENKSEDVEKLEIKVRNMPPMDPPKDDTSKSGPSRYKDAVFQLLRGFKSNPSNHECLRLGARGFTSEVISEGCLEPLHQLQIEIEKLTLEFDEQSIYKTSGDLIDLMIHDDMPSCKDRILLK
jgi:hypothetical protein